MPELAPVSRSRQGSAEAMEQGQRTIGGRSAERVDDGRPSPHTSERLPFKTISNPARQINEAFQTVKAQLHSSPCSDSVQPLAASLNT